MRYGMLASIAAALMGGTGPIGRTRTTAEGGGKRMSATMREEKQRERQARKAGAMASAEAKRERRRLKRAA